MSYMPAARAGPTTRRTKEMEQYFTVFADTGGEYNRFWIGVSTERMKDGKGTGKYSNANIQARLSKEAEEVFLDCASKTKNKKILMARLKVGEFYLMAATPKDRELDDYVYVYIKDAEEVKEKEKPKKKSRRDEDEEEDE